MLAALLSPALANEDGVLRRTTVDAQGNQVVDTTRHFELYDHEDQPISAQPKMASFDQRCQQALRRAVADEEQGHRGQIPLYPDPLYHVTVAPRAHADQVTHSGPTLSTVAQPRSLPRPNAPGVGPAQPPSPTGAHVARLGACTSPVGTLHQACVKDYCLTHLAMHPSPELRVACPICRSDYRIVPRGVLRRASGVKLPSL